RKQHADDCPFSLFIANYLRLFLISVLTLDVDIALALDASFLPAHSIGNALGILYLLFAERNLFPHKRLFARGYLFLTNGNPVGLALANWRIRWVTGAWAALNYDFFVGHRHIDRLLLADYLFAQANYATLNGLFIGLQLLLAQLHALLLLRLWHRLLGC